MGEKAKIARHGGRGIVRRMIALPEIEARLPLAEAYEAVRFA